MKHKQILISGLIIAVATIFILIYAWRQPDEVAIIIISIYIITVIFMLLISGISNSIYKKNNPTIDIMEFSDITERLNTEIILWTNDCSAVFMNKKLREEIGIDSLDFDNQAMIKKVFDIENTDDETINLIVNGENGESHIATKDNNEIYIVWSTSLIKKAKNTCLYMSTGFNFTELKKAQKKLEKFNKIEK